MTAADDNVKFICDVRNVEDLLLLPNTNWVIGSGFNLDPASQNYLHLFNAENETGVAVQCFRDRRPAGHDDLPGLCSTRLEDVRTTRPRTGRNGWKAFCAVRR